MVPDKKRSDENNQTALFASLCFLAAKNHRTCKSQELARERHREPLHAMISMIGLP
jgi:hypothetical protein